MVWTMELEVTRASKALGASATFLSAKRGLTLMRTLPEANTLNNSLANASSSSRRSEPRDRQSGEFESHTASGFPQSINCLLFVTENRQFRQFIILTMMVPFQHDIGIVYWRF